MKQRLSALVIAAFLIFPALVSATPLDEAKAQGRVGEKLDGYLGVVTSSPEIEDLVERTNAQRRTMYREIASKNGTSLEIVETLAGKKAVDNTVVGHLIQLPSGKWTKK